MGLFSRLGTLIRSNINELINRAEDPKKMLDQVLVDMKTQLVDAKKQVAVAIADEKRLKRQYEQEFGKATEWERKAMLAIRANNDELAKAALKRKAEHERVSATLKTQWDAQKQSVDQLKDALRGLDSKIEEAKRKRNILVSRQKRAEAQQTINETLAGINSTGAFATFDRMAERVTQLEAEAEATAELSTGLPESNLESQFKALESGDVDDNLEALKQKMALAAGSTENKALDGEVGAGVGAGSDASTNAPQATAAEDSAIDDQLEALKRKLSAT
ncbi:MAG: PspA/IM30 family protein [Nannocystaceae bacterium]